MSLFAKTAKTAKTEPIVSAERVMWELSARYSPIKNLTPALLSTYLDEFAAGELRSFALLSAKIEERDDKLMSLAPKRRKSVSGLEWEITSGDDSQEAKRQKDVLETFYTRLTATSATDEDEVGGIKLLIRYMLKAVSHRWSAQEIVWEPKPTGLTATFRDVPLWYFEHRTSRLRYLASEGAYDGVEMLPGEWLVTRAEGLMIPAAILYQFKHMPLRDWLIYCQRYVVPGLHGKTPAAKGSTEWNALVAALKAFGMDWAVVTNEGAEIVPLDVSARGELPYPKLVERCDRAMAILYRGADLSTMSAGDGEGTGASLQGEESDILVDDDIDLVEETLERRVTPFVLRYALGADEALCRFQFVRPDGADRTLELETDDKLIGWGVPVAKNDLLARYGRPQPDAGEELATAPAQPTPFGGGGAPDLGNARPFALLNAAAGDRRATVVALGDRVDGRLQAAARDALAQAMADDLSPLRARIQAALANSDDQAMLDDLNRIPDELPGLLLDICRNPSAERVLEESMTAALLNGIAEGAAGRETLDLRPETLDRRLETA